MRDPEFTTPVSSVPASQKGTQRSKTHANPVEKNGPPSIFRNAGLVIGPKKGLMVGVILVSIVTAILETALLFMIARLASGFVGGRHKIPISVGPISRWYLSVGQIALVCAGLLLAELILVIPLSYMTGGLSSRALSRARSRVISTLLATSWSRRSEEVEDHFQRLMGDDSLQAERIVQQWSTIAVSICGVVMLLLGAIVIAPIPAIFGAVAFFALALALRPMSRRIKRSASSFQALNRNLMTNVAQAKRMDKEIAAFGVSDRVSIALTSDVVRTSQVLERLRFSQRVAPMVYLDAALATVLLGIVVLSGLALDSAAYLGPLVLIMVRVLSYVRQLQTAIQASHESAPYFADLEEQLASLESATELIGDQSVPSIGKLEIHDLSFAYVAGHQILNRVNLTIDFGEIVGLVGGSGAGKTTLTELLLRLRRPDSGEITVSGVDIFSVARSEWSALVAYVPQENSLIRATIAENIKFYRDEFDREQVERAARGANLHDEILEMPMGYDTMVGPGERSMSGGQRQRLGIARALLSRPQLIVLDEPTSALDDRSERLIKNTLTELAGSATVLVVAHRPTTLEVCSKIFQLGGGDLRQVDQASAVLEVTDET